MASISVPLVAVRLRGSTSRASAYSTLAPFLHPAAIPDPRISSWPARTYGYADNLGVYILRRRATQDAIPPVSSPHAIARLPARATHFSMLLHRRSKSMISSHSTRFWFRSGQQDETSPPTPLDAVCSQRDKQYFMRDKQLSMRDKQ
ncbi:hypothetical protein C8R43DRAFT_1237264 [Mycena crocata]|nr:hypothetical protein C8R43DRAFT_1237264 [Mycena crocata]